jgi:DNA-binding CsgD family transcriptional regulator
MLRFVAEAGRSASEQPFTSELLHELGRLVEADAIAYSELDRVRRRDLYYAERAPGEEPELEFDENLLWDVVIDEDPLCLAQQLGDFRVRRLSDCLTRAELHAARFYDLWLRPFGVEFELDVALPSPQWHTKTFMFSRHEGSRDFTERDRFVLELLQPHLAAMWSAASARRLVGAAMAELDGADENDARGVVFLTQADLVEFASPPARRLLRDYFGPGTGVRLPAEVARWLANESAPLRRRRNGFELIVERTDSRLVLRERKVEPELTGREREVLAWVARGKTNPEIAELLWLSPGTVRKHLENVYGKLGVNTRTAAATRFLGLLEAEGS